LPRYYRPFDEEIPPLASLGKGGSRFNDIIFLVTLYKIIPPADGCPTQP